MYDWEEYSVSLGIEIPCVIPLFRKRVGRAKLTVMWFLTGSKIIPKLDDVITDTFECIKKDLEESIFQPTPFFK